MSTIEPQWSAKQNAVRIAILESDADRILLVGPVQSGKSYSAVWAFADWVHSHPDGSDFIIASYTDRQLRAAVIKYLNEWALANELEIHTHRGGVLGFPTSDGGKATLWPLFGKVVGDESKAKAYSVNGALVDEASDVPESFFAAVGDRCSKPGAKIIAMCNPHGPEHWLKAQLVDSTDPGTLDFKFTLTDNPTLTERYIERLGKRYTGAQYKRMVLGEWAASTGLVWPQFGDAVCEHPPRDRIRGYFLGVDDAQSGVLHAVLVATVAVDPIAGDETVEVAVDEYRWDGRERGQLTAPDRARRIAVWLAGRRPHTIHVDPSASELMQALGRECRRSMVRPADNDVANGLQFVGQELTAGRLMVSHRCEHLVREATGYAWAERFAQVGEDRPVKENDHSCDALRYSVWSRARGRSTVTIIRRH